MFKNASPLSKFPQVILIIILSVTLFNCDEKAELLEGIMINEFLAINENCCADEYDEYDDWVEIYNSNNESVNIGGMYFSDKVNDSKPYQICDSNAVYTTIPPKGFLVLWCDGDENQGPLHINLKLSGNGESVILIDRDGKTIIDGYTFGNQKADVSMGRNGDDWVYFEYPTPGQVN